LLEDCIFNAIKEKLAKFKALSDSTQNEVNPKVRENELKLVQLENEIDELLTKVTGANAILMDYINQKIEELDGQRKKLHQENITMALTARADKLNIVHEHVKRWAEISFEDKQSVVDTLIKVIRISNGEIAITWNL